MAHPLLSQSPGRTLLLLGNQAIVRGAVEAGVNVVTCYPGTPSSEAPDTFHAMAPDADYYFEYSTNEKVALEVGAGATLAGAMTLVTMKHVGVNVAADPLMTLAYIGAPGGLVLLTADDPFCHSSQNEQDNRYYARLGGLPCFEPHTAQECKDMARDALILSRQMKMPVLLRTTTRVNHLRGPVVLGEAPKPDKPKGFVKNPKHFVPVPAFARPLHVELMENLEKARERAEKSPYNRARGKTEYGVVATGISRAYLADALSQGGLKDKYSVLEMGMTYPLPEKKIARFLKGKKAVVILEELEPVLETEVRALVQKKGLDVAIRGKDLDLPRNGEYSVPMVEDALRRAAGMKKKSRKSCASPGELPVRPPNLCAGCPHRASYVAVRRVFGDDAVYSSDIGCYTLGLLPPLSMADFLVCMGSSVSAGTGVSKASGQTTVGFIGDSTFFHSGITGLVNAVHNGHDLLLVVLDNRTTAMTGHQPHPGVDEKVMDPGQCRVDMEAIIKGCGVCEVRKVNPLNMKSTIAALEELKAAKGVRVLIAEEPCPLYARRVLGQVRPMIAQVEKPGPEADAELEPLACPAFVREEGHIRINELLCNGCMVCLQLSKRVKSRKRSS